MSYSRRSLLFCALYMTSCRTANIERFVDALVQYVDLDETIPQSDFVSFVDDLSSALDVPGIIKTDAEAQRRLMAHDLSQLRTEEVAALALPSTVEVGVRNAEGTIRSRLAAIGLRSPSSSLFIVDSFPQPFDKFDWAAFAPDSEDEANFGIARGVYFKASRLRPLYSEALYAHEVIHTLTGDVDPEVYVSGLEEGIAEVVGTCYAGLGVLSRDVLKRILVYGRHGVGRAHIWSLYRDHLRQACLLFSEFGLDGLAELIVSGRDAIHHVAPTIVSGTYRRLRLQRGTFDEATRDTLEFACTGFVPSHAYTPLDCLLMMSVRSGMALDEVCERAGVDPSIGAPRLKEAGGASALYVVDGPRIGYSNVERLLDSENATGVRLLRYVPMDVEAGHDRRTER